MRKLEADRNSTVKSNRKLTADNEKLTKKNEELESQVAQQNMATEKLRNDKEGLEEQAAKHEEAKEKLTKIEVEKKELEAQAAIHKGAMKKLKMANNKLKSQATIHEEALGKAMSSWCNLGQKLARQFDEMKNEISPEAKYHGHVSGEPDRRKIGEELQRSLAAMMNEKKSIEERYKELLAEQESSRAKFEKDSAEQRAAIESMKKGMTQKKIDNAALTDKLNGEVHEREELQRSLGAMKNEEQKSTNATLEKIAIERQAAIDSMKREMSQMKEDHDAICDKLERKVMEKEGVQRSLTAMVHQKESLWRQNAKLVQEQMSTNATIQRLAAERQTAVDSMIPTKEQLAATIQENSKLSKELQDLKRENNIKQENIDDVNAQLDETNCQLNTVRVEKSKAEKHAQELNVLLEHYKNLSEEYKEKSEEHMKEKVELNRSSNDMMYKVEELEISAQKKDAIIADLRAKMRKMDSVVNHVVREKDKLMWELNAATPGGLSPEYRTQSMALSNSWIKYFNEWIKENGGGGDLSLVPAPTTERRFGNESPIVGTYEQFPMPIPSPMKIKQDGGAPANGQHMKIKQEHLHK